MGLRYPEKRNRLGENSLYGAVLTPEIDFSKDSLEEQAPETTDYEKIGGGDAKKTSEPVQSKYQKGLVGAVDTAAKGGSAMDIMTTGLMSSGHPVAMGAGLALKTAQGITDAQNKKKKERYDAEVRKAQARQEALQKLANLGSGLGL